MNPEPAKHIQRASLPKCEQESEIGVFQAREQDMLGAGSGSPGLKFCCKEYKYPLYFWGWGALKPCLEYKLIFLFAPAPVLTEPLSVFAYQGS